MVKTQNTTNSGVGGSETNGNEHVNVGAIPPQVPPLDPQNFGAFLAAQTQLIHSMMQPMQNMANNPPNINVAPVAYDPPSHSKLVVFMRTRPPYLVWECSTIRGR